MKQMGSIGRWNSNAKREGWNLRSATSDVDVRRTGLKSIWLSAVVLGVGIALTLDTAIAQSDGMAGTNQKKPAPAVKEETGADNSSGAFSNEGALSGVEKADDDGVSPASTDKGDLPTGDEPNSYEVFIAPADLTIIVIPPIIDDVEVTLNNHQCVKVKPGPPDEGGTEYREMSCRWITGNFCPGKCRAGYYVAREHGECVPAPAGQCKGRLALVKIKVTKESNCQHRGGRICDCPNPIPPVREYETYTLAAVCE